MESFSHGMKQRLVMCAAFLHRPRAVLVDEPMVGLDPRGARLIKDIFRHMSQKGVAILMSTHTLEVAQEMCDRISIILRGQIIARGTVDELRALAGGEDEQLTPVFLKLTGGVRPAGDRGSAVTRAGAPASQPFPYLLLPALWAMRNRARRREHGRRHAGRDLRRASAVVVGAAIFGIVFWLTWQLLDYEELGDYLIRLGLSWLFLTFLSFLAFSGIVTSLSTFFLSEDLRLLLAAPVPRDRLFYSRFVKTVGQAGWMVVAFLSRCCWASAWPAAPGPGLLRSPRSSPSSPSCSSRWRWAASSRCSSSTCSPPAAPATS